MGHNIEISYPLKKPLAIDWFLKSVVFEWECEKLYRLYNFPKTNRGFLEKH